MGRHCSSRLLLRTLLNTMAAWIIAATPRAAAARGGGSCERRGARAVQGAPVEAPGLLLAVTRQPHTRRPNLSAREGLAREFRTARPGAGTAGRDAAGASATVGMYDCDLYFEVGKAYDSDD